MIYSNDMAWMLGKTRHISDDTRNVLMLRGARSDSERDLIRADIMAAHRDWLTYLTVTQRHWQGETRNPNKARHHDSITIREQYVGKVLGN